MAQLQIPEDAIARIFASTSFRAKGEFFAALTHADNADKTAASRVRTGFKPPAEAGIIRLLRIFPKSECHPARADLFVENVETSGAQDCGAILIRARAMALGAGIKRDRHDRVERRADSFKDFRFRAFRIAFDKVDTRQRLFAHEGLDGDRALPDFRPRGEDGGIGARGGEREIDFPVFAPDDLVKGVRAGNRRDVPRKTGEGRGVRLETECRRAIAGRRMREFPDIGADIKDDALRSERDMPSDAVFSFQSVKSRRPALAIKLPAQGRWDGDPASIDQDEKAVRGLKQADIAVVADRKRGKRALAQHFQALGERELQEMSRRRRAFAIRGRARAVTPREEGRP